MRASTAAARVHSRRPTDASLKGAFIERASAAIATVATRLEAAELKQAVSVGSVRSKGCAPVTSTPSCARLVRWVCRERLELKPHPRPPKDPASLKLGPLVVDKGGPLFRIHAAKQAPLYFGKTRDNRFDAPAGEY